MKAFLLMLLSTLCLADDKVRLYLSGGMNFASNSEDSFFIDDIGAGGIEYSGSTSPSLGLELQYRPHHVISLSLLSEWTKWRYRGGLADDTHFSLLAMPSVRTNGPVSAWAGIAMGIENLNLGRTTYTEGSLYLKADQDSKGFVFSPRVGADFQLADRTTLGMIASYYLSSVNIKTFAQDTSTNKSALMVINTSRKWFSAGFRVGIAIGGQTVTALNVADTSPVKEAEAPNSSPSPEPSATPSASPVPIEADRDPAAACCVICTKGKACGDACIAAWKQCRQPSGCACDSSR